MRRLFLLTCALFISFISLAQNDEMQTLFNNRDTHHGFYVAPTIKFSSINNETAFLPGIKAAWTINRAMAIGFEGSGLAPTIRQSNITSEFQVRPLMGYGGFFVEPVIGSNRLVHFTVPVLVGAGWVGYVKDWGKGSVDATNTNQQDDLVDDQVIWVVEPGAMVELNVARFFRVSTGVTYRFTQKIEMVNTDSDAFSGWNYMITLKFGRF